ncbi:hypothetical protein BMF29_08330 [Comamonas kerstersii]|nr:hypothetical protein BMF29_08330 [Comamonas kerstersii]
MHGVLYALYGELNNKFLLEKILCIQRVQRKCTALMYELEMVFEKSRESNKVAKQSLSFFGNVDLFFSGFYIFGANFRGGYFFHWFLISPCFLY